MILVVRFAAAGCLAACVAGCGPTYSPDTYSAAAVQQANKVDKGVIVGVRQIDVSANDVVGAATGAAAGGVLGSQAPGGAVSSTFGAIGGGLVGGIIGSSVQHATDDTTAFEYIVRKPNNDLVSVTQKDAVPLRIGQHVLVISGNQARIVPDYTVNPVAPNEQTAPPGAIASPASPPPPPPPPAPPAGLQAGPTPLTPPPPDTPPPPAPGTEPPPVPVVAAPLPQAAPPAAAATPATPAPAAAAASAPPASPVPAPGPASP